jgi:hypothetical protein
MCGSTARVVRQDDVPLLIGHVDEAGMASEAGVVHEHVDAAELLLGGLDQGAHLVLARHVAGPHRRTQPRELLELGGGFQEAALVTIGEHHAGALFRTAARGGEPDPGACGRRHEHAAPLEDLLPGRGIVRRRGCLGHARGRPSARSAMRLRWIWLEPA